MASFKFGLIADTQYANRPPSIGRYYRNALEKTKCSMNFFRTANVDFIVHLGDIVDWPNQPDKGCEALDTILPILNSISIPVYYVLGNHDLASVSYPILQKKLDIKSDEAWYSFDYGDVHFILLDCNFDATAARYCPHYSQWDQCYIPEQEQLWLRHELQATSARTIVVFVHALLDDFENPHVIRNAAVIRGILESAGKQVLVFQGHMHCGRESQKNGIQYHTLKSIVDGRSHTCFWIVEVTPDGLFVDRYDYNKCSGKSSREWLLKFSESR